MKKVWVNGSFDVLHVGHIRLLKYASEFGLVRVGLDTDKRIKEKKGESRPINTLYDRMEFMRGIRYVNDVVSFDSDEALINSIKEYEPDYFIIGSDYKGKKIIGDEFAKEIIFFDRLKYSSTDIIKKITEINEKESSSRRRVWY
jgi:D-beta-D-heptose 7-phosphate kinase/D-beta-D-heptose 1-phosphate adenosyltransferase